MINSIVEKLRSAQSVVLSTHRHGDGDGLGSQLALFHALRGMKKHVRIVNLDKPPRKYSFLETDRWIEVYPTQSKPLESADVALILDTNDERLVEPLFSELKRSCGEVMFIDHHPVLTKGPRPTPGSLIDTSAASTGELTFEILRQLGAPLDAKIARALYTSVVFDTQMFRYMKGAPQSHLMAAELLKYEREPEEIHRALFATYTVEKMEFFARALAKVEYLDSNRIAFIRVGADEFKSSGLALDESGDLIDLVMNIESIEVAALLREDAPGEFKMSLRSKGSLAVLPIAESMGGGGHAMASGAYLQGDFESLRTRLLGSIESLIASADTKRS